MGFTQEADLLMITEFGVPSSLYSLADAIIMAVDLERRHIMFWRQQCKEKLLFPVLTGEKYLKINL